LLGHNTPPLTPPRRGGEKEKNKKMKNKLDKKSRVDLMKELNLKRLSLRDIRFGVAGSKNKNVKEQKNTKKDIARIHTALKAMSDQSKNK
jgi:ribosomal protein L29